MIAKIIGLVVGALVFASGLYYRAKDSDDPESRKIYAIVAAVGAVVAAVSAALLFA